jgi:ankyrin repeat protein
VAAKVGNVKLMEDMLKHVDVIDVDQQDLSGLTALYCAAIEGQVRMVGELLAKGANIYQEDKEGLTALHWAAYSGQLAR